MLSHLSEQERLLQTKELLESALKKELDLSGLIMARNESKLCGAILSIIQPDLSAFVWPPVTTVNSEAGNNTQLGKVINSGEIEDQLLQFLGEQLDSKNVWMGQCIVDLDSSIERQALQRNQFGHAANLIYMYRDLSDPIPDPEPDQEKRLEITRYADEKNLDEFKKVLEKTYLETLDCTVLNNVRTPDETLESHQLSGEFLPSQWKRFQDAEGDIGLLLMNDHPDQNAWEVVYTGVIPEARGKGYGREIVLSGLLEARDAERGQVILAVDAKNPYAHSVYESLGFMETTRKSVHIRLGQK